jgi:IS5 family transposase
MTHELAELGGNIDWAWIDGEMAPLYSDKGRPGIESRFVGGLLLLKHVFGLWDEGVCERWVYNPYFLCLRKSRNRRPSVAFFVSRP